jgi:hypothetical protein
VCHEILDGKKRNLSKNAAAAEATAAAKYMPQLT